MSMMRHIIINNEAIFQMVRRKEKVNNKRAIALQICGVMGYEMSYCSSFIHKSSQESEQLISFRKPCQTVH